MAGASTKCGGCGAPNPAGRIDCYACGAGLAPAAAPPTASPNPLRPCLSCGNDISIQALACPACGHSYRGGLPPLGRMVAGGVGVLVVVALGAGLVGRVLPGIGAAPRDRLVGAWVERTGAPRTSGSVWEFRPDGMLLIHVPNEPETGTYRWSVTGGELQVQDPKGELPTTRSYFRLASDGGSFTADGEEFRRLGSRSGLALPERVAAPPSPPAPLPTADTGE